MLPFLEICISWRREPGIEKAKFNRDRKSQVLPQAGTNLCNCTGWCPPGRGQPCREGPGYSGRHTLNVVVCPGCRYSKQCHGRYSLGHSQDMERRDFPLIPSTSSMPHPMLGLSYRKVSNRSLISMFPNQPEFLGRSETGACAL